MLSRVRKSAAAAALLMALVIAGCSSPSGGSGGDDSGSDGGGAYGMPSEESSAPAADGAATLAVADSALGSIVVDGDGMTLYMFDKDTQGSRESACTGECLTNWPPFTVDDAAPSVDGITGEVGTITTADGSTQVTLNGWPLYYFAGDTAAGDVNGQGVGGIWWVLTAAGEKVEG
ncbi:hypothetical protein [Streptomyces sp. AC495_CC817]|uniref:COG4315 family predicted lipoprotein n=1 Tax=Streptomyces sp. AC495_CC817 TaxID=2823900 RepID=UPI001C254233|nr:hypothetical protein [Streptomyces sp. AC495_CC817]